MLAGDPELQTRIIDSAMSQIPVIGDQLGQPDRLSGGTTAIVLGLLGFLCVASVLIVLCVEINAVRVDHLHPRAQLTPFTDNVEPTEGDENPYTGQAEVQRNKGFQDITVTYDEPGSVTGDSSPNT